MVVVVTAFVKPDKIILPNEEGEVWVSYSKGWNLEFSLTNCLTI